jgi:hypothetical protein
VLNAWALRRIALLWTICVWLLAVVLALLAPTDVLDQNASLAALVGFVDRIVPLSDYTRSQYPQVSQAYFAIAWLGFPAFLYLFYFWWGGLQGGTMAKSRSEFSAAEWLGMVLGIPFFIVLGVTGMLWYQGQDSRLFAIGSSRAQLGLLGMLVPLSSALCLSGAAAFLAKLVFGRALPGSSGEGER